MPHVILIVIVLVALVMLVRWLFRSPETALRTLPVTAVSDAKEGETCKLVGTVSLVPDVASVVAPFTGREALVCVTRIVREEVDGVVDSEAQVLAVEWLQLEDDSGTLQVQLSTSDQAPWASLGDGELKQLRLVPMERVDVFLEKIGKKREDFEIPQDAVELPPLCSIEENVLLVDERVVLVGRCSQPEGEDLVLTPQKGKLLFVSNDQQVIAEMVRGAMESAQPPKE